MYSLDIETLTSVLLGLKVRGGVEAKLSSSIADVPNQSRVVVVLNEGRMISITIYDSQGYALFQGKEAFERIRQKVLTWQLVEAPPEPPQKSFPVVTAKQEAYKPAQQPVEAQRALSPVDPGLFVPVRVQQLSTPRQNWSRTRRRVYSLVNGTNSIAHIAHLLALPVGVVLSELQSLQAEQVIILHRT